MKVSTDWAVNLDFQLRLRTRSGNVSTSCATCKRSGSQCFRRRCTSALSGRYPIPCWMSCSFESPIWKTFRPMRPSNSSISVRWYPPHCPFCSSARQQRYTDPIIVKIIQDVVVTVIVVCAGGSRCSQLHRPGGPLHPFVAEIPGAAAFARCWIEGYRGSLVVGKGSPQRPLYCRWSQANDSCLVPEHRSSCRHLGSN